MKLSQVLTDKKPTRQNVFSKKYFRKKEERIFSDRKLGGYMLATRVTLSTEMLKEFFRQ